MAAFNLILLNSNKRSVGSYAVRRPEVPREGEIIAAESAIVGDSEILYFRVMGVHHPIANLGHRRLKTGHVQVFAEEDLDYQPPERRG